MTRWEIRVLYDGACPVCRREAAMLRWLDRGRGRLDLEDIAAPDFDARKYRKTPDELMTKIHGVLPTGRLIEGVEVFRRAYDAVGFGWLLAPTNWPVLKPIADTCYEWFARHRLRFPGRSLLCSSGRCRHQEPSLSATPDS